mgnify:CR=1 FL=1
MSNNLKKYSFSDLLKLGKLRIPKIQRDYAQGRQSQKVDEIRKVFVHSLLLLKVNVLQQNLTLYMVVT